MARRWWWSPGIEFDRTLRITRLACRRSDRLEVNQRGAVEAAEAPHEDRPSAADEAHADRVRPDRRAQREGAAGDGAVARVLRWEITAGVVEPVKDDLDPLVGLDTVERGVPGLRDLDMAFGPGGGSPRGSSRPCGSGQ